MNRAFNFFPFPIGVQVGIFQSEKQFGCIILVFGVSVQMLPVAPLDSKISVIFIGIRGYSAILALKKSII